MQAWSTSMLLLLHLVFLLSVVKLLLKGEVGVYALNSHGNYIVDHGNHGNMMELCFLISVGTLVNIAIHAWYKFLKSFNQCLY